MRTGGLFHGPCRWTLQILCLLSLVNGQYPTRITRLSLQSAADHAPLTRAVKPGTSVEILCTFEEGKPALPPFLQNSQGELLDVQHEKYQGEIKHVLPNVTCEDVGTISCEAPGAMENKSAELLVECPPKFTDKKFKYYVVSAEQPVELMFQLQIHSREIASCHVTKYPGSKPDVEGKLPVDDHNLNEECLSDVTLFGSPPHLTLKMTLRELTSQDVGKWHLTIANKFGLDNISFAIEINGLPACSRKSSATHCYPCVQYFPVSEQRAVRQCRKFPHSAHHNTLDHWPGVCVPHSYQCCHRPRRSRHRRHYRCYAGEVQKTTTVQTSVPKLVPKRLPHACQL